MITWNYIKQIFKKTPSTPTALSGLNKMIVYVQKDGRIFIDLDISNKDENQAKYFGSMLFLVNEGYCSQIAINLLSSFATKNPSYIEFVQNTMAAWSTEIDNYNNCNPIVSPANFYKNIGGLNK